MKICHERAARACFAVALLVSSFSCVAGAQTTMDARKNCAPPRATHSPEPSPSHYPRKDSAVAGLNILIDEKGRVLDPKIVEWSGSDAFDRDAMVAVRKWRFKPSTCDGKPISVHIGVQIHSTVMH